MNQYLHLSLWAAMLCSTTVTMAQGTTPQFERLKPGVVRSISPNGKNVVGNLSDGDANMFGSYLWTSDTRTLQWQTNYDETDFNKSGKYLYITDNGIITGAMKDPAYTKTFPGDAYSDPYTYTFVNATVWKNGKATKLGLGSFTVDDFAEEFDGSYAAAASADGSVIAGYIYKGYIPCTPCGWKYDAATDKYTYFNYEMTSLDAIGAINGLSADGKTAVGYVSYNSVKRPVIWLSPDEPEEILLGLGTDSKVNWGGEAAAISPNGRYALIAINSNSTPKLAVYDITNDKANEVAIQDVYQVKGLTIDDQGNFFCQITDNKNYENATYYYSTASHQLISMDYFMKTYAQGLTGTGITNTSVPVAMSADGTQIVGYVTSGYGYDYCWWLQIDKSGTIVPGVTDISLYATGMDQMAVAWKPLTDLPQGTTLKAYEVYVDGDLTGIVTAAEAEGKQTVKFNTETSAGSHSVYVLTQCTKNGQDYYSDASETKSLSIPSSYALPMTDDFESKGLTANYWTKELVRGNVSDIMLWPVTGESDYDFENRSFFTSLTSLSSDPFEATLTSRFFDARNITNPYLVFYGNLTYVNSVPTDLSKDAFDVEYTLDGETWNKLYTIPGAEVKPYVWNFYKVDLSALGGKVFQLRFNAHGEGKSQLRWAIDYVTVGNELCTAPEGVRAINKNGQTNIIWKDASNTYEVSYLANSTVIPIYNVGNVGKPIISAIDLPAEKMTAHVGEYITSVSSFIYDDTSKNSDKLSQAEAIIYEDGKEVSRQAFDSKVALNPYTSTVALTTPVKIAAGKSYRIAVRIHDYDAQQNPLYYQANKNGYIPGTTDLFSEDEGKTWQTISEFNKDHEIESRAWCIWPIRAHITETATPATTPQIDQKLMAYNIFRNGVQINTSPIYAAYMKYTDEAPVANGEYTVQAFYSDGRVSALSAAGIQVDAISTTMAQGAVSVKADRQAIRIDGQFDQATLVSLNGQTITTTTAPCISTVGLNAGVYILTVAKAGQTATYKMVVR